MNDIRSDISWLSSLLEASSARHRAISSNLANVGTEGYRPFRVEFEAELRELLSSGDADVAEKIAALKPRLVRDDPGRSVVIEQEVMDLMKNQLAYDTYTQVISMKIGMLRAAITNRGS